MNTTVIPHKLITSSPEETSSFGERFATSLYPGDVVGLTGGLGAGKTCLIQGMCRGLGVEEDDAMSPTFTLINEYRGRYPIYHFDFYRISRPAEFFDLGIEDYLDGSGVCLIEWVDRIREYLSGIDWIELIITILAQNRREIAVVDHTTST
ncbi:MAG: tRNA (adenosine(37)-N6)-threonylcarbamoyltransferase complex ATPase subunit type 1 TsaE [Candidatus Latescibacteria bacterium]|nr:tRNA (adenosine(37)-N6)-threonylcarbamoyltransferase complex ATPase subunit type 1 TsaE [Candidatus Latescibacterota bacterium]